jgi:Phosphopantetheine attachment site.
VDRSSEVLEVIFGCLAELNKQLPPAEKVVASLDTTLIGEGGSLDSLALVTLIASIEQSLSERLSVDLPLIDEVIGDYQGDSSWTIGRLQQFIISRQTQQQ